MQDKKKNDGMPLLASGLLATGWLAPLAPERRSG